MEIPNLDPGNSRVSTHALTASSWADNKPASEVFYRYATPGAQRRGTHEIPPRQGVLTQPIRTASITGCQNCNKKRMRCSAHAQMAA